MQKTLLFIIYATLYCALAPFTANAQTTEKDSTATDTSYTVTISLLTCTPGTEVYQLYGHTALRVKEGQSGRTNDWVFNYGTFSFRKPHFMWRFVLGETDYQLGVVPFEFFYEEYVREGRGIFEQKLNLTQSEAKKLADSLAENLRPENATYRYNFFYDNCVTRAVQMIGKSVDGKIIWPDVTKKGQKSLRDIVHEYSKENKWDKFGQDLLLGKEADNPAFLDQQMFAPMYALQFVSEAKIKSDDGSIRPLALRPLTLLPAQLTSSESSPISPTCTFGILFALTLVTTLYEWKKKKYYWALDSLMLALQGLAGCIVTFLFFFSAHPTVGSNWLVILLNPLPLLYVPWQMKNGVNHHVSKGMYVEGLLLLATLFVGILGLQKFPTEIYLVIATLTIRVITHNKLVKNSGPNQPV